MFDLKNAFIVSPSAIADHQLFFIVVGAVCYCLMLAYYKAESRKLKHIPSTESNVPLFSYLGALKFLLDSRKVVNAGLKKWPNTMFKIPDLLEWVVVTPEPSVIDEIRKAPENSLSSADAFDEALQTEYTLGAQFTKNPYHAPIIRAKLTRALPQLMPEIHEEVVDAFNEFIPLTSDWSSVKALDTFMNVICRVSNRIFVGRPLCRDPEFVALNVQYTKDVAVAGTLLRLVPTFLRPLANKLVSNVPKRMREGLKQLAPLFAARRKQREASKYHDEQPLDILTWMLDEAKGEEATDWYLTARILAVNFAAIHTSSMTFTHAFYYLAAFPEYMKPLREEVEDIVQREGWTKAGIDQMHKIDSFIKESQRLHPLTIVAMKRIAVNDHTFSDGTTVPRGTTIGIALDSVHLNEKIYPDALRFDPFRFVKLKEQDITGRRFDLVTTGVDSLGFGHGRHSCPGRYFAACELKLMLAHVVMNYDVKLENEGVRPKDMWLMVSCVPNPDAKVLFRKRVL
ncbi:hypothetical protein M413DRAFT_447671 [Hebeloma cylindrosporum]|uniref:Cytochrome P450 n=1 Tax=Hebeloma cylindrosporum TaxID=76867 RepID=A0A0C3C391_HEBCY|nr:hypothetical protein M413DRAFT_447671 [Hebeloma cylindrosporum h7]